MNVVRRACRCVGVVLVAAAPQVDAAAQTATRPFRDRLPVGVRAGAVDRAGELTRRQLANAGSGTGVAKRRSLATPASVVGGALVGAWLGYFVSQVVMSDWEGADAAGRLPYRRRFTLSGAAIGAVGGYLLRPRPRAGALAGRPTDYFYIPRTPRHYVTRAELRRAVVLNALEAVERLRPEWLGAGRGSAHTSLARPPTSDASDTVIAVYVVDTRVGGPEALAEIAIPEVEELRLYEAEEAKRRWGSAHPHGAIEVVPVTASPPR